MIPKTSWIVFTVDATGVEVKVDFVLSTKISDDKLEEILSVENEKRNSDEKPPLRYEEFDPHSKDPILYEAERQFMRNEGIGKNAEFESFKYEVAKEMARLKRERTLKETTPPSPEKPKRENFKFPKDQTERTDLLCSILQDLKNGKDQTEISKAYRFDESLWTKSGKKGGRGLGQYLPKLKERALSYARDRKARLERRVNEGDTVDFDDVIDNKGGKQKPDRGSPDWLFCAVLLGYIDEVELDPEKDINRREVPMGQLTDRGKWE